MQIMRKIIEINEERCTGCGECIIDCAEGSLEIVNGKAKLVSDNLCDGLGACLQSCPTGALKIVERIAEDFDEKAVEEYLAQKNKGAEKSSVTTKSSGCPSTQLQSFPGNTPCQTANTAVQLATGQKGSLLAHWPVQIRLIPATAPFLQGADILVVADCCAVAAPDFQAKYLQNKVVMMGCPKFDDQEMYSQRFAEIIASCGLSSISILIMEVPCCSAMNTILQKAMERAGQTVSVKQTTLSTQGAEIETKNW